MEKKTPLLTSVAALILPMAVGILSSRITGSMNNMDTYPIKPPFVPPGWAFPVVWVILYTLMGIAFYQILNADVDIKSKKSAIWVFLLQLFLNFLWPIVFFRFGKCVLAAIIICVLWFLIFLNVLIFGRIKKCAGMLLIPYLLWVGFAIYLNLGFCFLN